MLSVELHTHSEASFDGRDPVELILQQARSVGLDAIAITDHDEIWASLEAVERAPTYDLIGIPGIEISSADGHVLALGVEEVIPAGLEFEETLTRIWEQDGLAIAPHPFQESRSGLLANISGEQLAKVDAIEVYNSQLLTGRSNWQAKRFARRNGLPMTAGSDAHICEMVGQAVTNVNPDQATADSILEEIRTGRTVIEGSRTPWRISVRQALGGVRRRIAHRLRTTR